MKKNTFNLFTPCSWPAPIQKIIMIINFTTLLMIITLLQVSAEGYSQITLNERNVSLEKVLKNIESQTDYVFFLRDNHLKDHRVNVQVNNVSIEAALSACFKDLAINYKIIDKTVVVRRVVKYEPKKDIIIEYIEATDVRGKVTNKDDTPLSGVSVRLKGTSVGTVTDANGQYIISVPNVEGILVFSYIGFVSQEIEIDNQDYININLEIADFALSEIVVTALGIKRERKAITYSTQGVNVESLSSMRETNIMTSLQGKVAGLRITESGTGIGGDTRVLLRGNRSISGDSQPLYVVDGVPVRGNPAALNSDNIESINVLKGPNAAALYGSAAQNGAIIITTKTGKKGVSQVSLNSSVIMTDPIMAYRFQNEYGQGTGGIYNKGSEYSWGPKMVGQIVDNWSPDPAMVGGQYALTPQPNNIRDYFRTGMNVATSLSANLGNETTQTLFSYTFTQGQGTVPGNDLDRHNVSVRMNNQLSERFSLDSKIEYIRQKIAGDLGAGFTGQINQIYSVPRSIETESMKDFEYKAVDGSIRQNYWNPGSTWSMNPYWTLKRNIRENGLERVMALTALTYKLSDELNFLVRVSYDGQNNNGSSKLYNDNYNRAQFGRYSINSGHEMAWNGEGLISYNKDFDKDWNVNFNVGANIRQFRNGSMNSNTGNGLTLPNLFTLSNTQQAITSSSEGSPNDIQSIYGFTQVGWRNAIYLDITGRNDWSSTLPSDNRSYFYPSVGLSAVVSDLIPSFPSFFSFAKVRVNWAQVGNSAAPFMLQRSATLSPGGRDGFLQVSGILPNENLRPETTESTELGIDLRFFNGKLAFDGSIYKTNTYDQLFTINLPVGSGASQFFTNGGNVENKGIELMVSGTPLKSERFSWDVYSNFSKNKNTVIEISDDRPRIDVGSISLEQGKPWGNMYSRGFVRDANGKVIVNGNGIPRLTSAASVLVANFTPDWVGSVSNTFNFKNFNFNFLIDHRQGGSVLSYTNAIMFAAGVTQETLPGREGGLIFGENLFPHEIAVKEDGSLNDISISSEQFWLGMGGRTTFAGEVFAESATNTRLRELSIGYSFPASLMSKGKLPFSSLRFSLVGRNLFFIYRDSPTLDPDISSGTGSGSEGDESYSRPTSRTFGANLTITF